MLDEKTIIKTAITCYGIDKQRIKCIEELSELQKELCKASIGPGSRFHIAEEVADVLITVEQMVEYYGIADFVKDCKAAKLEQLAHSLNLDVENDDDGDCC